MGDPLIGSILADSYRIIRVLGKGSVGRVYLDEQVSTGWQSAIKILRPEYADHREIVQRFRREARAISRLEHPNIVRLERSGQTPDEQVYLVMEYIRGPSLRQLQRNVKPVPLERALDILQQVCAGVGYAHGKGIVHRDLKPENVLLITRKGRVTRDLVKLLDFGMAKILGGEDSAVVTREGQVFGTPAYMSPEQCMGRDVDERADIYAVGCLAYELISGRVPFWSKKHVELMLMQTQKKPRDPNKVRKDRRLPTSLCKDVLRCLRKRPKKRFQTLDAFAERIAEHLARERRSSRNLSSGFLDAVLDSEDRAPTDAFSADEELAVVAPTQEQGHPTEATAAGEEQESRGPAWYFARYCRLVRSVADEILNRGVESREVSALLAAATKAEDALLREETDVALLESQTDELEARRHQEAASLHTAVYDLHEEADLLVVQPNRDEKRLETVEAEITRLGRLREELEKRYRSQINTLEAELERRLLDLPELQEQHTARHFALGDAVDRHRPSEAADLADHYLALAGYRDVLEKAGYGPAL